MPTSVFTPRWPFPGSLGACPPKPGPFRYATCPFSSKNTNRGRGGATLSYNSSALGAHTQAELGWFPLSKGPSRSPPSPPHHTALACKREPGDVLRCPLPSFVSTPDLVIFNMETQSILRNPGALFSLQERSLDLRHPCALSVPFCPSWAAPQPALAALFPIFPCVPVSVGQDEALWGSALAPHGTHRGSSALHRVCWLVSLGRGCRLLLGHGGTQPHCATIPACEYMELGIRLPCLHLLLFLSFPPPCSFPALSKECFSKQVPAFELLQTPVSLEKCLCSLT